MQNDLNNIIAKQFPDAELSCPDCQHTDVKTTETNSIGYNNPLGERRLSIYCGKCGHADEAIEPHDVLATVKKWLVSTAPVYTCSFEFFYDGTSPGKCLTEIPRLNAVTGGFWINEEGDYADVSENPGDCAYWVPESRVFSINKKTKARRLG